VTTDIIERTEVDIDQDEKPLRAICPFCGGHVVRVEISDSSGVRAFSLCCDMPTEFIDNYEVYEALPELLQQLAIERKRDEYAAMDEQSREDARLFKESLERWREALGAIDAGQSIEDIYERMRHDEDARDERNTQADVRAASYPY